MQTSMQTSNESSDILNGGKKQRLDTGEALPSQVQTEQDDVSELEQREWLLKRPDTFLGSMECEDTTFPLFHEGDAVEWTTVNLSPAMVQLFLELIVNALDNAERDDSQTFVSIEFDPVLGKFEVKNDGSAPPVSKLPGTDRYKITGCWGGFQCGNNFNDDKKRKTSGRNGVGAAAANTFGKEMIVSVHNVLAKQHFTQKWEKNMSVVHPPIIRDSANKSNEVKVTWYPDFKLLLKGQDYIRYSPSSSSLPVETSTPVGLVEMVSYMAYCASLSVKDGIKVKLNKKLIKISTTEHFCKKLGGISPVANDTMNVDGENVFSVSVAAWGEKRPSISPGGVTMGFVNTTPSSEGSHADYVVNKICILLKDFANEKKRKDDPPMTVTSGWLRENACIVLKVRIDKPRYKSQRKHALDTPQRDWGWSWTPSDDFLKSLKKSSLVQMIIDSSRHKSDANATKSVKISGRKAGLTNPKYEPAQELFKGKSVLCVTEGDSAKNFVIAGISEVGRKHYGVYPIRGKFRNVRDLTPSKITENKEARELLQILGLTPNKKDVEHTHDTVKKLPYSELMVISDQDVDGTHIAALIYNMVDVCAPSLLKIKPNFVCRFATSLIRVKVPKISQEIGFYSEVEYEIWRKEREEAGESLGKASYYKGLGTSSAQLAKEYFRNLRKNKIYLTHTGPPCSESLDLFFNKDRADDRKQFLNEQVDPSAYVDYSQPNVSVEKFVHNELLPAYAGAAIERAIPALDGLNNARRKILWGARSINLTKDALSVANAAGKISSETNYHHRGKAMEDAIIGMAADFAGCGNINLFVPEGQFGTRHSHEAASAAYPKTILNSPIQNLVYPPLDNPILEYVFDEGRSVEPKMYVPIIAMPLCFGADGIAVGWSTKCPAYHPIDLIEAAESILNGTDMPTLVPWYRGFGGEISAQEDGSFLVRGKCERTGDDVHVTEVPPFKETDAYKEDWLKDESLAPGGVIAGDNHDDRRVHIILKKCKDLGENPLKSLGLEHRLKLSNVHFLNLEGKVQQYTTPEMIVRDHAKVRLETYSKRIAYQIKCCEEEATLMEEKARFIQLCVDRQLDIQSYNDDDEVSDALLKFGFHDKTRHSDFLKMPLSSLNRKRVASLMEASMKKQEELRRLRELTPQSAWKKELEDLREELMKDQRYVKSMH